MSFCQNSCFVLQLTLDQTIHTLFYSPGIWMHVTECVYGVTMMTIMMLLICDRFVVPIEFIPLGVIVFSLFAYGFKRDDGQVSVYRGRATLIGLLENWPFKNWLVI